MPEEIWVDVVGYEGLYQVSNLGRLKSLDRLDGRGYRIKGSLKKISSTSNGYQQVTLYREGVMKSNLMHRIVASAFLLNPDNKKVVNHINGDKQCNAVSNLSWVTYSENALHAYDTGLRAKGDKHAHVKISDEDVLKIRELYATGEYKQKFLAAKYGVDNSHISDIVNNKKRKLG